MSPLIRKQKTSRDGGSAIVAALWLSLILALLSIAMITMSRDALIETKTQNKLTQIWLDAESGLSIAKFNIASRQNPWVPRDQPYVAQVDGQDVAIHIKSPRGKIDINAASPGLMAQLFAGLGYEPDIAAQMADQIADWRDADDLVHLNGAESDDYELVGLDYGPANEAFTSLGQLKYVLSISSAGYDCISPFLTMFSQSASLEPAYAGPAMRQVLGLPEPVPGAEIGYRRSSLAGQVFEISADVTYSENTKARLTEIIRYTGIASDPVWIHKRVKTFVPGQYHETAGLPNMCPDSRNE